MKTIEIHYRADYFQAIEAPDNASEADIIRMAKEEIPNIDFQDGSVEWEPVFYQSPDNPEEWNIID